MTWCLKSHILLAQNSVGMKLGSFSTPFGVGLLHEVVAFRREVGWSWNVLDGFTSHVWHLVDRELRDPSVWGLSFFIWLDPQNDKVVAANPLKTEDQKSYNISLLHFLVKSSHKTSPD